MIAAKLPLWKVAGGQRAKGERRGVEETREAGMARREREARPARSDEARKRMAVN
ncbi:uncharacterized protein DS421_7g222700 [Arachis hypogaea]|nr:uncharacterized protein DS421_7g222700 [Arachis hypogaea]